MVEITLVKVTRGKHRGSGKPPVVVVMVKMGAG